VLEERFRYSGSEGEVNKVELSLPAQEFFYLNQLRKKDNIIS
jgi:hypothetical protein